MGQPLTNLLNLQHVIRAELRQALVDLDLTPVQNTVMHLLAETNGRSSAELARITHVTPQTMHRLVTELQRRGLVELQARPGHGRILDAHLADQGRKLLAEAEVRERAIEDRMVASLDDDQRQGLSDLLLECIAAFDEPFATRRPPE